MCCPGLTPGSRSPCRLKVEELEGERGRLEEEKRRLEAQLEHLTLQVSTPQPCGAVLEPVGPSLPVPSPVRVCVPAPTHPIFSLTLHSTRDLLAHPHPSLTESVCPRALQRGHPAKGCAVLAPPSSVLRGPSACSLCVCFPMRAPTWHVGGQAQRMRPSWCGLGSCPSPSPCCSHEATLLLTPFAFTLVLFLPSRLNCSVAGNLQVCDHPDFGQAIDFILTPIRGKSNPVFITNSWRW